MNDKYETIRDAGVDKAIDALNTVEIAPGPPAGALQAVLDAAGTEDIKTRKGILHMNRITKIAASILVLAAVGAAFLWMTVGTGGATVAWADVQRIIRNAQTMTFKMEMQMATPMPGGETIETTMHCDFFAKEPGLMRQEITMFINGREHQQIMVMDMSSEDGVVVMLTPEQKLAIRMNFSDMPDITRKQHKNYLAEFKRLVEGSNEPLGEREIDGQLAHGFRVTQMGIEMDIWVDSETALLVLIEGDMFDMGNMKMTDFQFDVELDDELFDMTIPEGYKIHESDIAMGNLGEADLIVGLQLFAELNDNVFPSSPMITPEIMKNMGEKIGEEMKQEFGDREPSEQEIMQFSQDFGMRLARVMMFIQTIGEENFKYFGNGVQLGDAQSAVCWYKPKDSDIYRVIYGDLHVEDVAEADLPAESDVPDGMDASEVMKGVMELTAESMEESARIAKDAAEVEKSFAEAKKSLAEAKELQAEKRQTIAEMTQSLQSREETPKDE